MGRESHDPHSRLITRLKRDIGQINFYRFCQLLEQQPGTLPLGSTNNPADDPVRFRPHPGMGFPVSELKALETDPDQPDAPLTARTTFMGLYGVDSPLPTAYIDDITQQREGHEALEGFLDIFNHRFMTQFYRIWRKYSYPATFESGGKDNTSQSLLGLVGMGIPGSQQHFATPTSRFLALLGVMRQPGRTAEGVQALVRLLAPFTQADVTPHCLRTVRLTSQMTFADEGGNWLDGYTVLGDEAIDANSQLLISLQTEDRDEAGDWLPDGPLYTDFLVLLRVYLGWRYRACIQLTVATRLLPALVLDETPVRLGLTGVLGLDDATLSDDIPEYYTVELGHYSGLTPQKHQEGNRRVSYYFEK
ncbi:TPA: type VI secretion system baseplate subunit TssG [Yersinia enterocolitica]|uniref:type VI secretion system baseplate subunit TssG n=1 Tax=Yersinia TaxID=629 RepID=UPI000C14758C|nr:MULTISPECIES: type VI secretion system baseplate subunit TssG [Yersinia]EKN6004474.1 type VI secretion system baseplate subunit TssG [Yersinia enterocolitica]EMA9489554.1 type VI secretion system baseplate subunit TssG [Yersinia enterocolitica]MCB5301810.1 type VI secretion system baseplate subunit TssG [Yersinia bercovieri]PHZ22435.1 type VI secretion system baseplate subunit TssG [Yersinia massiliensis]HDL8499491.1 type VI secretion system baseplate subunit TssG [Yersinia enterocolitica]